MKAVVNTSPTTTVTKKERPSEGSKCVEFSLVVKKKEKQIRQRKEKVQSCFGSKTNTAATTIIRPRSTC